MFQLHTQRLVKIDCNLQGTERSNPLLLRTRSKTVAIRILLYPHRLLARLGILNAHECLYYCASCSRCLRSKCPPPGIWSVFCERAVGLEAIIPELVRNTTYDENIQVLVQSSLASASRFVSRSSAPQQTAVVGNKSTRCLPHLVLEAAALGKNTRTRNPTTGAFCTKTRFCCLGHRGTRRTVLMASNSQLFYHRFILYNPSKIFGSYLVCI